MDIGLKCVFSDKDGEVLEVSSLDLFNLAGELVEWAKSSGNADEGLRNNINRWRSSLKVVGK